MLAIIAGQGRLPALLAERLDARGETWLLCAMEPFAPEFGEPFGFRLERLGLFLADLKERGVTSVCFAGAVRRPRLDPAFVDPSTIPLLQRLLAARGSGDDGALRVILSIFEEHGFTVQGAGEIAPELSPPAGILTKAEPGERDVRDAERAEAIVRALGPADVGQACVVSDGQAVAVEALPGTDHMLRTLIELPHESRPEGGLLYKAPKPGQDRRVDLPTIGPDTATRAAEAGLKGIVVEAGGIIILDQDLTTEIADREGLFLWVRERAA